MPKHLLSFVFNNSKIPVEVGILSKEKKIHVVGTCFTEWYKHKYKHYLIEWEGKHIMFFQCTYQVDKKGKTLQAGLFIFLTFRQCGCDI